MYETIYDNSPSPSKQPDHIGFADSIANEVNGRFNPGERMEFLLHLKKTICGNIHSQIAEGEKHLAHLKEIAGQIEKA